MVRRHIVKTLPRTWGRRGFLPEEQYYLSEISRAGAQAPYIQAIIRKRLSLNANRVRLRWSIKEYRKRVVQEYERMGLPKFKGGNYKWYINKYFYDYLEAYKERTPTDPEYESPKRKRRKPRFKKQTKAQTSRRKMLQNKIEDYNQRITRAIINNDQRLRKQLEKTRNKYERQLDNLR